MSADQSLAIADGVHALTPRATWSQAVCRLRDSMARVPGAPLFRTEFGYYCQEAWRQQGMPDIKCESPEAAELFQYEREPSAFELWGLGWCEPAYVPRFEVKIIEDRGDTEVEQDRAGRHVLYFKGRRNGFMPEYLRHPVSDLPSWHSQVAWRLDPRSPARYADLEQTMADARVAAAQGQMIVQRLAGSFMYLRAMLGVEELLFAFHDQPRLIETAMQRWLELSDAVTAAHQRYVTFDHIFFAEDNCYNHGPLVAPDMLRTMLLPYYKELLARIRARQLDQSRHIYIEIDTDGDCRPLIPFYMQEIGMDAMSPFEVASGCDVVAVGREYPGLHMRGGIDKRVLASGRQAIDAMLERIIPALRQRGGYIPVCDHGVPAEVPYQDYLYYRRRCVELGG